MTSAREAKIEYFSCNIVLEVNVTIEGFGTRRMAVLAWLPGELMDDHDAAEQHVLPFVAAVQHGDPRAIAKVARALNAESEGAAIYETYYDPTGFDRDEWMPKLLCRVGDCGKPVAPGSTYCRPGCTWGAT